MRDKYYWPLAAFIILVIYALANGGLPAGPAIPPTPTFTSTPLNTSTPIRISYQPTLTSAPTSTPTDIPIPTSIPTDIPTPTPTPEPIPTPSSCTSWLTITSPQHGTTLKYVEVKEKIAIIGTVKDIENFSSFILEYGITDSPQMWKAFATITEEDRIRGREGRWWEDAFLANWPSSQYGLSEEESSKVYSLRLTVYRSDGQYIADYRCQIWVRIEKE